MFCIVVVLKGAERRPVVGYSPDVRTAGLAQRLPFPPGCVGVCVCVCACVMLVCLEESCWTLGMLDRVFGLKLC